MYQSARYDFVSQAFHRPVTADTRLGASMSFDSIDPPASGCQFDPDIVHAPSGSMMGLLRRVPLKWPSGEATSC